MDLDHVHGRHDGEVLGIRRWAVDARQRDPLLAQKHRGVFAVPRVEPVVVPEFKHDAARVLPPAPQLA